MPRSNPQHGLRAFQFSLRSVFVVVTVVAIILSIYISLGQGISWWLMRSDPPAALVWIVGLAIAARFLNRNRLPATLTIIALCGFLLTWLARAVVLAASMQTSRSDRNVGEALYWAMVIAIYLSEVVKTTCWALILTAVFVPRTPDPPEKVGGSVAPCDRSAGEGPGGCFSTTSGLRVSQFSLRSVFLIVAVIAMLLSIYISLGQWRGMSTRGVLLAAPMPVLVWIVGLAIAQFSLRSVFVIVAVMAMILSVYFGVGWLMGMSTRDVLMHARPMAYPPVLIWIVGLAVLARFLNRNRLPATLAIIALCGFLLTWLAGTVVMMISLQMSRSDRLTGEAFLWVFLVAHHLPKVFNAVWWILILRAIFVRRTAGPSSRSHNQHGPYGLGPS